MHRAESLSGKVRFLERSREDFHASVRLPVFGRFPTDIHALYVPALLLHRLDQHARRAPDIQKRAGRRSPGRTLLESDVLQSEPHQSEKVALICKLVGKVVRSVASAQVLEHGARVLEDHGAVPAPYESEAVAGEEEK